MTMKRVLPLIAVALSLTPAASWASAQTTRNSPEERRAGRVQKANAATLPSELADLRELSLVLGRL
jgi:hypothetical protein